MAAEQQRGAMSGNALTRKVGPLPVWGWAVGLLVGYFLYQHFKGSIGSTTTPATSTDTSTPDMNPVPAAGTTTDSSLGPGFGTTQDTTTIAPPPPATTNPPPTATALPTQGETNPAAAGTVGVPGGAGSVKVSGGRLTQ